jgi:hypothetical protein
MRIGADAIAPAAAPAAQKHVVRNTSSGMKLIFSAPRFHKVLAGYDSTIKKAQPGEA